MQHQPATTTPTRSPQETYATAGTRHQPRLWLSILPVCLVFLLLMVLTESAYLADTARYMVEIQNHRAHLISPSRDPFWDFGHAAWRPMVNTLFGWSGQAIQAMRGGDARQAMAWLMIAINVTATAAGALLLWLLLKRHSAAWAASLGASAFLCTNAVLDYSRSGAPYVPALTCLLLSLWLIGLAAAPKRRGAGVVLSAALAGISLAASVLFWFPFVLATPAAIFYAMYQSKEPELRRRLRFAAVVAVFCGITVAVTYAAVIQKRQIRSFAELRNWAVSAENSWSQTERLKRAVSGIPRSFLDLGDDTLLMKRYVFHDPYTRVSLARILSAPGTLKLLLFYLYCGILVLLLWKQPRGRGILLLLSVAALPVLFFSIALFEPGGTERYLPLYPFFFLAAACALLVGGRAYRTAHWLMAAFLIVVLCAGNIYAKLDSRRTGAYAVFLGRKDALDTRARPDSMVAVVNFWDPLYRVPALRLLDSRAQPLNLWVYDVIEIANTRVFSWRQEFAEDALARWSQGREVWLSTRLLAEKPLPDWKWVEGDTGRVQWSELRDFFRAFDVQSPVGGDDGFVLLANDPRNEELLREALAGQARGR